MTYSELLHQVNFEEIAPYIGKYGSKERIALYKTHYDMLRLLEPREGEDDEKTVTVSNAELDYDFEEPHLDAYPIEGCYWEVALSKEIIVEPDVQATWAEIAACLLWHTSFYGFTPEQQDECSERLEFYGQNLLDPDITRIKAKRIQKIIEELGGRIPSKKEIMTVPTFRHEVNRQVCRALRLPFRTTKRKLARRKIDSLYWERILEIGRVVCDYLPSKKISRDEFYKVFLANNYRTYRYKSYAADGQGRGKWLWELITQYKAFNNGLFPNIVLCMSTSHDHIASMEDMDYLNELFIWFDTQVEGEASISLEINCDDSLGEQLRLSVISYE